jgi:hypothetical protein
MLALLGFPLAFVLSGAAAPGPCDLLARDAASQLLGAPVTKAEPSGPSLTRTLAGRAASASTRLEGGC